MGKKKEIVIEPTDRTRALVHMAHHLSGYSDDYIDKRYWEGFRTGLLQCTVSSDHELSDVQDFVAADKTQIKKGEWKKDPLKNGVINGRRFALTYLLNVDFDMVFGGWLTPA